MVWTYLHVCKPADWACRKNWHTDRMKRFVLILRRSCGRFFVYVWALMTFELCLKCQIFALIRRPYLLTVLTTQYCEAYFNKHTHTHICLRLPSFRMQTFPQFIVIFFLSCSSNAFFLLGTVFLCCDILTYSGILQLNSELELLQQWFLATIYAQR